MEAPEPSLTCLYLSGPARRHGSVLLAMLIKEHGLQSAVASTHDSFLMNLLLDLTQQICPASSLAHTYVYGGELPAFSLLPSPSRSPAERAGIESSPRPATSADIVSLGNLIGDLLPGYARVIAAGNLLVATSSGGLIVGAAWHGATALQQPKTFELGCHVREGYRRQGVGTTILRETIRCLRQQGCAPVAT
jgi:hypothetical protein